MSLDHNPQCSACKISNSLMWRRGTNGEVLCNSCHLKRVNSSIRTQRQSSKESKKLIARIKAGTRKGWNGKSGERSRGRRTLQKIKRKVLHIYWCWCLEWLRLSSMQCDNHLPSQWQNGSVKHQVLCGSFCEYWMQNESHFLPLHMYLARSLYVRTVLDLFFFFCTEGTDISRQHSLCGKRPKGGESTALILTLSLPFCGLPRRL